MKSHTTETTTEETKRIHKDDVVILAEATLEYWKDYDDGDYSPRYYCCKFCLGSSHISFQDVEHESCCPVLVAKDVMTGR